MANTFFTDDLTVIEATWLNDINNLFYTLFQAAVTPAQAATALGVVQTASNLGNGESNVYATRNVNDISFKSIKGGSDITVSDDGSTITIDASSTIGTVADQIVYTPTSPITAIEVQAALDEIALDYVRTDGTIEMSNDLIVDGPVITPVRVSARNDEGGANLTTDGGIAYLEVTPSSGSPAVSVITGAYVGNTSLWDNSSGNSIKLSTTSSGIDIVGTIDTTNDIRAHSTSTDVRPSLTETHGLKLKPGASSGVFARGIIVEKQSDSAGMGGAGFLGNNEDPLTSYSVGFGSNWWSSNKVFTVLPSSEVEITGDLIASGDVEGASLTITGEGPVLYHDNASITSGKITVSTLAPSGGADGDIWLRY